MCSKCILAIGQSEQYNITLLLLQACVQEKSYFA